MIENNDLVKTTNITKVGLYNVTNMVVKNGSRNSRGMILSKSIENKDIKVIKNENSTNISCLEWFQTNLTLNTF